jgi:hypothetical protein
VCWRLRNFRADPATANKLATAWVLQIPTELPPAETTVGRTSQTGPDASARTLLTYRHMANSSKSEPAAEADRLYGLGLFEKAVAAYQKRIQHDPGDLDAWAGLAVSSPAQDPGRQALRQIPEVVAEVYRQANLLGPPQEPPLHLARWLTRQLPAEHSATAPTGLPD